MQPVSPTLVGSNQTGLIIEWFQLQETLRRFSSTSNSLAVPVNPVLLTITSITVVLLTIFAISRLSIDSKRASHGLSQHQLPPEMPSSWPIIGNLFDVYFNKPTFRWIMKVMKGMNTNIACLRIGNVHVIPVNCPKLAREFLVKHDAVFASRPITMGTEYSSCGFLTIAFTPLGDQWKKMRRIVAANVINASTYRWLHQKRVEEANNLVFYVLNQCNKNTDGVHANYGHIDPIEERGVLVNVRVASRQYCANVTRKMMFNRRYFGEGMDDGGPGVEEEEHVEAIFTILSLLNSFCLSDYLPFLRIFNLDGHEKILKEACRVVHKYHDPIIEERIQQRKSNGVKDMIPEDLLDVFLSITDSRGEPLLSTLEIKAQIEELMLAAIDNPSNAAEWAMAEMINQPEILTRAVEEIDMVVGKERLVEESDISQLNYVKACAREAMRLHPVAPFNVPHLSMADTIVDGYFIPKGSHVLLSRVGLGRNPDVWDEPLKFKPERHLADRVNNDGSVAVELTEPALRFISFSTGRRGCLGVTLGSTMTIMLLARILQGFDWSAPACGQGEPKIDLSESDDSLFLAKPLCARAKPRLPMHVYPLTA